MKEIIALIPARGGSKSIPNKNIVDFAGKPLIAWSIEDARNSEFVKEVYVSTDDEAIADVAKRYRAEVIWRPKEISGDFSPSEEALKHAIAEIQKRNPKQIDYVVFLQATSPLRESEDIDNAVRKIIAKNADSLLSVSPAGNFLIWKEEGGIAKSVNYDYNNRQRRQDVGEQFVETGSLFIFKPEILFTYNNRLGGKIVMYETEFWKSFEIDTVDDLDFCQKLYQAYRDKDKDG